MNKTKLSDSELVARYITSTEHPLKETMEELREIILETDSVIGEHIKWNAPAFYFKGTMASFDAKEYKRDIVVFNLRKEAYILLIFPTGATINDTNGLLEGNYTDGRRMVTITGIADLDTKKEALQTVIKQWLSLVQK